MKREPKVSSSPHASRRVVLPVPDSSLFSSHLSFLAFPSNHTACCHPEPFGKGSVLRLPTSSLARSFGAPALSHVELGQDDNEGSAPLLRSKQNGHLLTGVAYFSCLAPTSPQSMLTLSSFAFRRRIHLPLTSDASLLMKKIAAPFPH